jgi:ribose 5-phosphate isomerase B
MIIYLAADHAGFELKEKIKKYLGELGHEIQDFGAFEYDPDDDYPDFIIPAARALAEDVRHSVSNIESRGIILGGSGQGEAMIANRFFGIRAAVCDDNQDLGAKVKAWREHNNSNVLSLGARFIDEDSALKAVKLWLEIPFMNEPRHVRRLQKIAEI